MRAKTVFVNVAIIVSILVFIAGCGNSGTSNTGNSKASNPPSNQPSTAPVQQQAPKESEWDELVKNAEKEGKLIIFGQSSKFFRETLIAGFNKKFPKITIEFRTAKQDVEMTSKMSAERRAGVYEVDVVLFASTTLNNSLVPAGYIAPIKDYLMLPEFKDPSKWVGGKLEYADNEEKHILSVVQIMGNQLLVNKNLVDVSKLQSYEDLLKPEYKGKIVIADPKLTGQSRYSFSFLYNYYGEDYFKKLAANEPVVIKDFIQLIDWVAHGKYAIGISPGNVDAFKEYVDAGIPLAGMQLKEGGYYSSGYNYVSVAKDAPHQNTTKLFVNWLFTKEGQEVMTEAAIGRSVRTDVSKPIEFDPNKKYLNTGHQKNTELLGKTVEAFEKHFKQ